jgi:anti-sigma B factor antagonist
LDDIRFIACKEYITQKIQSMAFQNRSMGKFKIVDLNGTLDIYTSTDLKVIIETSLQEGMYNFIINMDKLNYIDSSGIGMLIKMMNQVKEKQGVFKLFKMKPPLEKIFKVAGLISYFEFIGEKDFEEQFSN